MHPDAAAALLDVERITGGLVYTDIYRSPEAILRAYRAKPGTQPVGYSFHGYGGCVDIDVDATLKKLGVTYDQLLSTMAARSFYCHRRDRDPNASESWHFNFVDNVNFVFTQVTDDHSTWSKPAELMIQKWYGPSLQLTDSQIAALLPVAHSTDVKDFQRRWNLVVDGIAGPRTQRVLAFVTATRQVAMYQAPNT